MLRFFMIIFVFSINIAFAQDIYLTKQSVSYLDSLLLHGEFKQFHENYNELVKDSLNINDNYSKNQLLKNYYEYLLKSFNEIRNVEYKKVEPLIDHFRKIPNYFSKENAGEKSDIAYQKFLMAYKIHDEYHAIHFLQIALFFRHKNSLDKKRRLISNLEKAESYLDNNQIDSTLSKIDQFNRENKFLRINNTLKDSLKSAYANLEQKARSAKYKNQMEARPVFSKKWKLAVGFSPVNIAGEIKNSLWYHEFYNYTFKNKELINHPGYDYYLNIRYLFTNNFAYDLNVNLGYLRYSKPVVAGYEWISKDTEKHNFYALSSNINYVIHYKVGLQPITSVGIGYIYHERKPSENEDIFVPEYTKETDKVIGNWMIMCKCGVDYIPNIDSRFFYGIYLNSYFLLGQKKYIGSFIINLSLILGIAF